MTWTILAMALIAGLPAAAPAQGKTADFSGTWVLDSSKSEGLPPGMEQTMTVKQSGDQIEIETLVKGPQGEQRIPDRYVLDGKEADFAPTIVGGGTGKGKRTAKWSEGGHGFESKESATVRGPEGDDVTITASRKWTLSPSGDTLTVELTMNGPMGEVTSKRVFARQK
ncbi:MAG TPA: hypothetical protein VM364_02625 [Vicinamibacterales bacterium]|nr:hypothetical protein [Vicinamibacterales bacterium]